MNAQLFATLFVVIAAAVMVMSLVSPRAWAAIRVRIQNLSRASRIAATRERKR